MKLSQEGFDLIISFEGKLRLRPDGRYDAYLCPAGVWTIYAGVTEGVHQGMICTEEEGAFLFRRELDKHEAAVNRLVKVSLYQSQFDALVSFSYNVGSGALERSTLLRKLNAGDYAGAQGEFAKWDRAGKQKLRGLAIRRAKEAELFARSPQTSDAESSSMPQKVDPPAEPWSPVTVASTAAATGAAVPAVPTALNADFTNATAWKSIGSGVVDMSAWAILNWKVVAIGLVAYVAVSYGLPYLKRGT